MTDFYWKFVSEYGDEYLDCELVTARGVYFTNRCFLQLSGLIRENINNNESLRILMPEFSHLDVHQKLNGYVSTQKRNLIQHTSDVPCGKDMSNELSHNQFTEIHLPCVKEKDKITKSKEIKMPSVKKTNYQCDLCGLTFSSAKKSWNHKDQVHRSDTSFQCKICSAQFKTKSILSNHMKCHRLPSFSCSYCEKVKTIKLRI